MRDRKRENVRRYFETVREADSAAEDAKPIGKHPDGTPCWTEECELMEQGEKAMEGGAEYQKEYEEVVRRYKGTEAWMKAANGKPTNLTERQWVQVRTPSFKKWFGDWESKATAEAVLEDSDICSDGVLLSMAVADRRKRAREIYDEVRSRGKVTTVDGRMVSFTGAGFREIKHHSADPHTLALVPILRDVIASAHYIGDGKEDIENGNRMKYHFYARRVNLGDGSMVARIVLREDVNGNIFYDEESTSVENIREIADLVAREPNAGRRSQSPFAESSLPDFYYRVNRGESSKVVDENGEPKVVCHCGTFCTETTVPEIGSEGMHFGTEKAEMDRKDSKFASELKSQWNVGTFRGKNGKWQYVVNQFGPSPPDALNKPFLRSISSRTLAIAGFPFSFAFLD